MGRYTDDEIRSFKRITCKIAADYLGISPMAVSIGMRNDLLPIGFAIHTEDRYSESWSYLDAGDCQLFCFRTRLAGNQITKIETYRKRLEVAL